eukprot:TRINITY_DN83905_c0_g1_i1.p1 TRINITY_DN83905_c0_g1~~TRINITY_DN83905_c0_g1_i1.p1  ORF type:complete len:297 (-),score=47.24 TRINITY_DN83905_c0_g1_i1:153-1043(-)
MASSWSIVARRFVRVKSGIGTDGSMESVRYPAIILAALPPTEATDDPGHARPATADRLRFISEASTIVDTQAVTAEAEDAGRDDAEDAERGEAKDADAVCNDSLFLWRLPCSEGACRAVFSDGLESEFFETGLPLLLLRPLITPPLAACVLGDEEGPEEQKLQSLASLLHEDAENDAGIQSMISDARVAAFERWRQLLCAWEVTPKSPGSFCLSTGGLRGQTGTPVPVRWELKARHGVELSEIGALAKQAVASIAEEYQGLTLRDWRERPLAGRMPSTAVVADEGRPNDKCKCSVM